MEAGTEDLIKWLSPTGESLHGSSPTWPLPLRDASGQWLAGAPVVATAEERADKSGLHLMRIGDLWHRMLGRPFLVHHRGPRVELEDGVLVDEAWTVRPLAWSARERRLFALDCVARGFARLQETSMELRKALHVGRRSGRGEVAREVLREMVPRLAEVRARRQEELELAESALDAAPTSLEAERSVWRRASEALLAEAVALAASPDEGQVEAGAEFAVDAIVAGVGITLGEVGAFEVASRPIRDAERAWIAVRKWSYLSGIRGPAIGSLFLKRAAGCPVTP